MTTEREAEYIFYMACAVVGKVNVPFPNVRPDWQKIYEISAYHRIENIVAYAVEQLCLNKEYCEQIPDEVKKQFQKARLSGIMRETIQYHEYEKLTKLFAAERRFVKIRVSFSGHAVFDRFGYLSKDKRS